MRRVLSATTLPLAQEFDQQVESFKPSAVYPTSKGRSESSKQMQAAAWNGDSVEDDAASTDVVWNADRGSENQNPQGTKVSDCPMVSSLFLNIGTELKWDGHNRLVYELATGTPRLGFSSEASKISFMLNDILKVALSPVFGQRNLEPNDDLNEQGDGLKRTRYGANLTEEERRAERNRKGRERSMRTRRRNAAHLKMLEEGCNRLIMENRLLRDLLNCLQRVPLAEEIIISLLRSLLSHSRLPSAFHQGAELLLEGVSVPSSSKTPLTYHKMISNAEDHDSSWACDKVDQTCTLSKNGIQTVDTVSKKKVDSSVSGWEPRQILESVPEGSDVSKASMTTRKSLDTSVDVGFEARFHNSVDEGNEVRQGERSVLANFSLDEIDAVISL